MTLIRPTLNTTSTELPRIESDRSEKKSGGIYLLYVRPLPLPLSGSLFVTWPRSAPATDACLGAASLSLESAP